MSDPTKGRSLELYYIDGRPDGMLTAEMFNWTGHVLMAPRTQLAAALGQPEASYAGIYLLLGDRDGEPLVYVGEGEDISSRIKSHDVNKDWWTSVVLVTTAGNKLNKAHARYLEARLIETARKIGRTPLDNGTSPARPGLSPADISKMEAFIDNLMIVLPAVRVDTFIERARPSRPASQTSSPAADEECVRFYLESRKHGLKASSILVDGELIVEAGSKARLEWEGVPTHTYAQLHAELKRSGTLVPDGDQCVFAENYAFRSPSAAAAVIFGRASNGTVDWKTAKGDTYKMWESQKFSISGANFA